jgi:hypothetical protein
MFFGYCEAVDILRCRKCGTPSTPYIHPKWRKSRAGLNPRAKTFYPQHKNNNNNNSNNNKVPLPAIDEHSETPSGHKIWDDPDEIPLPSIGCLSFDDVPIEEAESLSICSTIDTVDVDVTKAADDGEIIDNLSQASSDWLVPDTRSTATLSSEDSDDDTLSQCSSISSEAAAQNEGTPTLADRRRIFNASKVHEPTGGTVSTFLTQLDFNVTGVDVVLDYDVDTDEGKVGVCKFECAECENEYTVICRLQDTAECFNCHTSNKPLNCTPPASWAPTKGMPNPGDSKHNCSRCSGKGHCLNLDLQNLV